MKFSAIPEDLLKAIKALREKFPMKPGRDAVIGVKATKGGLIVDAYLSTATVPADVEIPGEFVTSWKGFGRFLGTYPKGKPVTFALSGDQLRIDRLQFPVRTRAIQGGRAQSPAAAPQKGEGVAPAPAESQAKPEASATTIFKGNAMFQCPTRFWNEIASTQHILHNPWKELFALSDEPMAEALDSLVEQLKAEGADGSVVTAYLVVCPLLMENVAISRYLEESATPSLRSSLPEVTSISEAVALAVGDYRLTRKDQLLLAKLLRQAYTRPLTARRRETRRRAVAKPLDAIRAKQLAQEFVAAREWELVPCDGAPNGLYGADAEVEARRDYFFFVIRRGRVGGTECVAVSRTSGVARSMGYIGD
jgi:hypothetical protein